MSLYDEVYGIKYSSAAQQMSILTQQISQQGTAGFESIEELEKWAQEHYLDKVVYSSMSHQFMCLSHKGEIMLPNVFENYYGDVLHYTQQQGNRIVDNKWHPKGFKYLDKAYIVGEQSDGIHRPLYYRDYTVPTGYFSIERDAYNVAKPFPVFAKQTGRDTSHIYTYIQHISGECAMWLLAWLRAKLLYPTVKTQVVPIIVSRAQGSGKTTFAEVICKGLFGSDNVLVTDQYDSSARFNADYADALIVCQEEKEETDKRNPMGALKSRATATTIRKEQKGVDPIYQESYTDFIMTTNKDVPIKFDGREDQRRFMIMEADEHFTRKESTLADEVFSKLYGYDANFNSVGTPFVKDKELIAQFKHELFSRQDIANVPLRQFPKTKAYDRCFTLPRTSEATEIESILKALAPFIRASLEQKKVVQELDGHSLTDVISIPEAVQYMPAFKNYQAYIALCRPLIFYEMGTMKPYNHSTVERTIYSCDQWLLNDFGLKIVMNMDSIPGGFTGVQGRHKMAPAARFILAEDEHHDEYKTVDIYDGSFAKLVAPVSTSNASGRIGARLSVDKFFNVNPNGCFETVNEMKPGTNTLKNKSKNVQYLDTFLLESDTASAVQVAQEKERAAAWRSMYGEQAEIQADYLYKERLETSLNVSRTLFEQGIVARIVYSGAKSYHLLIRVLDAPKNIEEYKWLHNYLCTSITDKLEFDSSTADPARLTRAPVTMQRVSAAYDLLVTGTQQLVEEDWSHVYDTPWRNLYESWCNRPLSKIEQYKGKPLYPTKEEYRVAAEAIADGSFWSNTDFDGDRQRLFFPAYRVLRVLGFSHNELWHSVIPGSLSSYKKQNEIGYWESRESCALIQQIDSEIDNYNAMWGDDDE